MKADILHRRPEADAGSLSDREFTTAFVISSKLAPLLKAFPFELPSLQPRQHRQLNGSLCHQVPAIPAAFSSLKSNLPALQQA